MLSFSTAYPVQLVKSSGLEAFGFPILHGYPRSAVSFWGIPIETNPLSTRKKLGTWGAWVIGWSFGVPIQVCKKAEEVRNSHHLWVI